MGLQLWFHAHGIDESNVHKPYRPKSRGIGNSQILPYDYHLQADIELHEELKGSFKTKLENYQKSAITKAAQVRSLQPTNENKKSRER